MVTVLSPCNDRELNLLVEVRGRKIFFSDRFDDQKDCLLTLLSSFLPSFSSGLVRFLTLSFVPLAPFTFSYLILFFHFPFPPSSLCVPVTDYSCASRPTSWNKTVSLVKCRQSIEQEADE